MLSVFKEYIKWKLISLIKDKIMHYTTEKHTCILRKGEWESKVYDGMFIGKDRFEKQRKENIQYLSDEWKMNYHKLQAVQEIIKIVENL